MDHDLIADPDNDVYVSAASVWEIAIKFSLGKASAPPFSASDATSDMRRTLGSWQAATGASLVIIAKSLGPQNLASTQIYSRLDIDPVRDSMESATRAIFAAGGLLPTAEISTISDAKKMRKDSAA